MCVQVRIDSDLSARHSRRRPGPDRLAVFYQLVSLSIFGVDNKVGTSLSQFVSLYRLFSGTDLTKLFSWTFFFFRHQPIFHLVSPSLPSEGTNKPNLMPADCSNLEMVETLGVVWGGTNWDPSFNFQVWFTSNRTLLFLPFSLNCECRSPLFPVYQFGGGESVSPQLSILFSAFSHSLHTQHTQAHTHSTH